jgi:hypothetical protein
MTSPRQSLHRRQGRVAARSGAVRGGNGRPAGRSYGLTECSGVAATNPYEGDDRRTIGALARHPDPAARQGGSPQGLRASRVNWISRVRK